MFRDVKIETIREQVREVCKDFLGGPWESISAEDIKITKLKGGVANSIFQCSLPEDGRAEDSKKVPRDALFRIYGPMQEDHEKLVREIAIFTLLSERKLGPKLYGLFTDGRLEEFIPSHYLSSEESRLYAPLAARELAKFHALDDAPLRKVPNFLEEFAKWIDLMKEAYDNNADLFMSSEEIKRELKWISEEIEKRNSPVVFSHNDIKGGNFLFREDTPQDEDPKLVLIDYEFASYNYREYDLASYFTESIIDYDTPEYPRFEVHMDKTPSREEQVEFLRAYFDQASKEGVQLRRPVEEEIESVLRSLPIFSVFAHLKGIMFSIMMIEEGKNNEIGFLEFVQVKKILYEKAKKQHLALFQRQNNTNSDNTL